MQKQTFSVIKGVLATIGGGISYYLGGWDTLIRVMVFFVIVDWGTGSLCAALGKSKKGEGLSSYWGMYGIVKKVMYLAVVAVAYGFDTVTGQPVTRNITVTAIAINEMLSILENAALLGLWIPPFLLNILEVTKKQVSEEGKITGDK